jgi:hypothetical protein
MKESNGLSGVFNPPNIEQRDRGALNLRREKSMRNNVFHVTLRALQMTICYFAATIGDSNDEVTRRWIARTPTSASPTPSRSINTRRSPRTILTHPFSTRSPADVMAHLSPSPSLPFYAAPHFPNRFILASGPISLSPARSPSLAIRSSQFARTFLPGPATTSEISADDNDRRRSHIEHNPSGIVSSGIVNHD